MKINKTELDQLIPVAAQTIRDTRINDGPEGSVPDPFRGYISSFGASMVLSGPVATAIFFEDSSSSEKKRDKVPQAILALLKSKGWATAQVRKLSEWLQEQPNNHESVRQIVICATALKFALRTFTTTAQLKKPTDD